MASMMKATDSKKISFVLYEDEISPRFYEINKNFAKLILFGLPTLTLIVILLLTGVGVYFKQIQTMAERKEPKIIKELKAEKKELIIQNEQMSLERDRLKNKLAKGVENPTGLGFLALFKQSAGRQDLTVSPEMNLEEVEVNASDTEIDINFKIINRTKDNSRLTGYLYIIMQVGQYIEVWPVNSFDDQTMALSYAKGEYFATSRFRPVKATFKKIRQGQALFKIIVFSRTGDLIFKQLISRPV